MPIFLKLNWKENIATTKNINIVKTITKKILSFYNVAYKFSNV